VYLYQVKLPTWYFRVINVNYPQSLYLISYAALINLDLALRNVQLNSDFRQHQNLYYIRFELKGVGRELITSEQAL